MSIHTIGLFALGTMAFFLALSAGCSSDKGATPTSPSDPCSAASRCTAQPKPTEAEIGKCKDESNGGCGPQYKLLLACNSQKESCGPDNKIDTTALAAACKTELETWTKCKGAGDAGTDTGDDPDTGTDPDADDDTGV